MATTILSYVNGQSGPIKKSEHLLVAGYQGHLAPDLLSFCAAQICRGLQSSKAVPSALVSRQPAAVAGERKSRMGQRFCPQCSCDAASVLSFATHHGWFAAAVQCHVCGFEKPTDRGFEDEQAAREAAIHDWLEGAEPLPSTPRG
jgi:hypothetical protein